MTPLQRGRVAALSLLVAPLGSIASQLAPHLDESPLALVAQTPVLCAWLPAAQSLEHFLKRQSELGSMVMIALATLGIIGCLLALALASAEGLSPGGVRLGELARWATALRPLAWVLCGLLYLRYSITPPGVSIALLLGGICGLWGALGGGPDLALFADLCLASGVGWIALRILRDPGVWANAQLLR